MICKYADTSVDSTFAIGNTSIAVSAGFGAGVAYIGVTKNALKQKMEHLKGHAITYGTVMAGMLGSYFM